MEKTRERERERRLDEAEIVNQEVQQISAEEVRATMNKTGKAAGPDDIPIEAWRCLGELAVDFLTKLFNKILEDA